MKTNAFLRTLLYTCDFKQIVLMKDFTSTTTAALGSKNTEKATKISLVAVWVICAHQYSGGIAKILIRWTSATMNSFIK